MALTAAQRNALPKSAFALTRGPRSQWKYPAPTRAEAKRAGISESQRVATHRAALAYSARPSTAGSPRTVKAHVASRHQGAVKSMSKGRR